MLPHLMLIERAFDRIDGSEELTVKFDLSDVAILSRDERERATFHLDELKNGAITIDEYRQLTGRDPVGADHLFINSNLMAVGQVSEEGSPSGPSLIQIVPQGIATPPQPAPTAPPVEPEAPASTVPPSLPLSGIPPPATPHVPHALSLWGVRVLYSPWGTSISPRSTRRRDAGRFRRCSPDRPAALDAPHPNMSTTAATPGHFLDVIVMLDQYMTGSAGR